MWGEGGGEKGWCSCPVRSLSETGTDFLFSMCLVFPRATITNFIIILYDSSANIPMTLSAIRWFNNECSVFLSGL